MARGGAAQDGSPDRFARRGYDRTALSPEGVSTRHGSSRADDLHRGYCDERG
jgi:hypothetical protein